MIGTGFHWIDEFGLREVLEDLAAQGGGVLFRVTPGADDAGSVLEAYARRPDTSGRDVQRRLFGRRVPEGKREALAHGLLQLLLDRVRTDPTKACFLADPERWLPGPPIPATRTLAEQRFTGAPVDDLLAALLSLDNGVRARWTVGMVLHLTGRGEPARAFRRGLAEELRGTRSAVAADLMLCNSLLYRRADREALELVRPIAPDACRGIAELFRLATVVLVLEDEDLARRVGGSLDGLSPAERASWADLVGQRLACAAQGAPLRGRRRELLETRGLPWAARIASSLEAP